MSVKQTYAITPLAGKWVAGYRLKPEQSSIELLPEEAEYDLLAGTILPPGQNAPPPTPVLSVQGSDVLNLLRAGGERPVSVEDLATFLVSSGLIAAGQANAVQSVLSVVRGSADSDHNTLGKLAGIIATFREEVAISLVASALTQTTEELPGPPSDLPIGKQRLTWNTTKNASSLWMNRGGTIIDAFDPGSF